MECLISNKHHASLLLSFYSSNITFLFLVNKGGEGAEHQNLALLRASYPCLAQDNDRLLTVYTMNIFLKSTDTKGEILKSQRFQT